MHQIKWLAVFILFFIVNRGASAQSRPVQLAPAIKNEVIDSLGSALLKKYIYPDTAAKMNSYIKERLKKGAYDAVDNPDDFAQMLDADLHTIYSDLHMRIYYNMGYEKDLRTKSYAASVIKRMQFLQAAKQKNYGFQKVEILNGNIGYISIAQFYNTNQEATEIVKNAFLFLKNINALIIDVRDNPGGEPDMVQYICSYFFKERTHLNDFYDRHAKTNEYWTEPVPASTIFSTMPIYLLVNRRTGSAAEEFAYDLQNLHRVAIFGETTAGAAHWVTSNSISNGFIGNIPFRKAVNPVTHKNWEKVGVKSDVKSDDEHALDNALIYAYDHLINTSTDLTLIKSLKWFRVAVNVKQHPVKIAIGTLKTFTGNYKGRLITLKNGKLYFTDTNGYHIGLTPFTATAFMFTNNDRQIEFIRSGKGKITGFDFIYPGGKVERFNRLK